MCRHGMLVHCPSRLCAAATVLAAKISRRDGVCTKWAIEFGEAVHHLNRVMSHSSIVGAPPPCDSNQSYPHPPTSEGADVCTCRPIPSGQVEMISIDGSGQRWGCPPRSRGVSLGSQTRICSVTTAHILTAWMRPMPASAVPYTNSTGDAESLHRQARRRIGA